MWLFVWKEQKEKIENLGKREIMNNPCNPMFVVQTQDIFSLIDLMYCVSIDSERPPFNFYYLFFIITLIEQFKIYK